MEQGRIPMVQGVVIRGVPRDKQVQYQAPVEVEVAVTPGANNAKAAEVAAVAVAEMLLTPVIPVIPEVQETPQHRIASL